MSRYRFGIVIIGLCVLVGCSESLRITSTPPGATAAIWPTGEVITTPGEVTLSRKGTYTVRYHLDGYQEESVQVSYATAELSAIAGFLTGAGYRLVPNPVHTDLKRLDGATPYGRIYIEMPTDVRSETAGRAVAGTTWKACDADAIYGSAAADFVRGQLAVELRSSGLFRDVSMEESTPRDLIIRTQVEVFCSQAPGFLYYRVAGLSALHARVQRDDLVILEGDFERVVTDADPEYTGQQASGTVEQARRTAMGDSLRGAIRNMVLQLRTRTTGTNVPG